MVYIKKTTNKDVLKSAINRNLLSAKARIAKLGNRFVKTVPERQALDNRRFCANYAKHWSKVGADWVVTWMARKMGQQMTKK